MNASMNMQANAMVGCCTPGWPPPWCPPPCVPRGPYVPWGPRPWTPPPICPAPVFPGYAEGVATGQATERARLRKRMKEAGIPDSVIDMIVGQGWIGQVIPQASDLDGVIAAARRAGKRR